MSDRTSIEWTDASWNPIRARRRDGGGNLGWHCEHASPGCANCYAERINAGGWPPNIGTGLPYKPGHLDDLEIYLDQEVLLQPLRWQRPRMIFPCSMTDIFGRFVTDAMLDRIVAVMALAPQHTFQVLTKRSARMRAYFSDPAVVERIYDLVCDMALDGSANVVLLAPGMDESRAPAGTKVRLGVWPLPNVWKGVSVEDQPRADERVPDLRATPAAIRWLSCEPLLSQILFDPCELAGIDWLVAGGESGRNARPMHPEWAFSLRDQCAIAAGVPFHFKQWGEWSPVSEMHDQAIDACYHPAPEQHPEATRRCKVQQCVLHRDGQRFDGSAMYERPAFEQGSGAMTMFAIGKKRAGRLLDGVEHNGFPAKITVSQHEEEQV